VAPGGTCDQLRNRRGPGHALPWIHQEPIRDAVRPGICKQDPAPSRIFAGRFRHVSGIAQRVADQVEDQDQGEGEDQEEVQPEAQGQTAGTVLGSFSPTTDKEIQVLSNRLQEVGVGLSAYIVDEYKLLATEFGIENVLRGITAAAKNGKQHQLPYVTACIRNIHQGTPPTAKNGNGKGKAETPEAISGAWGDFLSNPNGILAGAR